MGNLVLKKWCTIAPVIYCQDIEGCLDLPFDFGHGVVLRPVPDWLREDQIIENLSYSQRQQLVHDTQFVFAVEYEAESLGDPDPDWKGPEPRSKQARARELIEFSNFVIWLARPSSFSFELIIHAEQSVNTWTLRQLLVFPRLIPHKRYADIKIKKNDLELARRLLSAIAELPRASAVWIAVRTLFGALSEQEWEIRLLRLWIAMEALFGPEDSREITYRISQRIAFFLATDKELAREVFNSVKTSYAWRSRVVHGMRLSKLGGEKSEQLLYDTENLIRKALNGILRDPQLVQNFSDKNRERYLDDLIFCS